MTLTDETLACALALGFDRAAILPMGPPRYAAEFSAWLAAGYHGTMAYLAERAALRLDPTRLAPDAASLIVLAVNYGEEPLRVSAAPSGLPPTGRIARYAWSTDYHDVLKPKLYALDAFIRERAGRQALGKVFVDTAPVLERDFAAQGGLGFIGRNTCLITPGLGSWTFLAGLLVPEKLETGGWKLETASSRRAWQGCGQCTRCLDACPTRAFVAPHLLDARRCISYLTIELRGPLPRDLRPLMGSWVFGCDICQEVCPYNHAASPGDTGRWQRGRRDFQPPDLPLSELLALDEAGYRDRFHGTPVMRAKRRGLVRNACVAAGNSGDTSLVSALIGRLADAEPLVRGHAAWALGCIGDATAARGLTQAVDHEPDAWVGQELRLALAR